MTKLFVEQPLASPGSANNVTTVAPPVKSYCVKFLLRIMRDLKQLNKEASDNMKVGLDENNFTWIYLFITGSEDTPYDGGFFYFTLDCPPNCPEAPPKALIHTTDDGWVRFNPNPYRKGWTSAFSLHSIVPSIQSLINKTPICTVANSPTYL